MHAETLTARDVIGFTWRERSQLLRFLRWTGEIDATAKANRHGKEADA